MKKPKIVELTPEHLSHFRSEPYERPINGVAMVLDDPIAIGGYVDHGEFLEIFSYTSEAASRFPRLFVDACCIILDRVDQTGKTAIAIQDPSHPTAEKLLTRFGLVKEGEYWRY